MVGDDDRYVAVELAVLVLEQELVEAVAGLADEDGDPPAGARGRRGPTPCRSPSARSAKEDLKRPTSKPSAVSNWVFMKKALMSTAVYWLRWRTLPPDSAIVLVTAAMRPLLSGQTIFSR